MYRDTITLFNRYDAGSDDLWFPTVLENVDLNVDKASIIAKYGENATDNARLHVRCEIREDGAVLVADKRYLPPKAWEAQTEAEAAASITFTGGQRFDFFIVGAWPGADPVSDAEYTDGFYNFCNRIYDYCFAVTSVAQYSVIPHFEIMAK